MHPYQYYVNYMLSVYFAPDRQHKLSQTELKNCAMCDKILRDLSTDEQTLIKAVFSREKGTVKQNVLEYAESHGAALKDVWRAIRVVSQKIAREKELI